MNQLTSHNNDTQQKLLVYVGKLKKIIKLCVDDAWENRIKSISDVIFVCKSTDTLNFKREFQFTRLEREMRGKGECGIYRVFKYVVESRLITQDSHNVC